MDIKLKEPFINWMKNKNLKSRTIDSYLSYYNRFPEVFNQNNVDLFTTAYSNSIAPAFINNLRSFLLHTKPEGVSLVEVREVEVVKKTGRKRQRIPKIISEEECHSLSEVMDNERDKIMLFLSFYSGLRVSGLVNVRVYSFNWDGWMVDKSSPGELKVIEKGDKERIVIVPAWLMARLERWISNYAVKSNADPDKPLFKIGRKMWWHIINKASQRAYNAHIHPHILRHSCATWLLECGMRIEDVKDFLGHNSITTTQVYVHINREKLKNKYAQIKYMSPRKKIIDEEERKEIEELLQGEIKDERAITGSISETTGEPDTSTISI